MRKGIPSKKEHEKEFLQGILFGEVPEKGTKKVMHILAYVSMHTYFIEVMNESWAGWIWVTTGYIPYYFDMVVARNYVRVTYASIVYML